MQELARDVQKLLLGAQTDDGMTEEHKVRALACRRETLALTETAQSVEGVHSIADQVIGTLPIFSRLFADAMAHCGVVI